MQCVLYGFIAVNQCVLAVTQASNGRPYGFVLLQATNGRPYGFHEEVVPCNRLFAAAFVGNDNEVAFGIEAFEFDV